MELSDLAALSRDIGRDDRRCVILGEGNTSCQADQNSFHVKASGRQLALADEQCFARVRFQPLLEALDGPDMDDAEVSHLLQSASVGSSDQKPSTESFMHAYLLSLAGVEVVIHTHPTPLLSLLCLHCVEEIASRRLFPDEIVCCGPRACLVPYADPGLALARAVRAGVQAYLASEGGWPKTIWIRNHGLICLGRTGSEAMTASVMSVKAAEIWLGILSSGQPYTHLDQAQIERINKRPDEHYRQRLLWGERQRGS